MGMMAVMAGVLLMPLAVLVRCVFVVSGVSRGRRCGMLGVSRMLMVVPVVVSVMVGVLRRCSHGRNRPGINNPSSNHRDRRDGSLLVRWFSRMVSSRGNICRLESTGRAPIMTMVREYSTHVKEQRQASMRQVTTIFLVAAAAWLGLAVRVEVALGAGGPPNIVLMMADDLGFSDLGCYGGEIATPHLDGLAKRGVRFTQFYNTGRCWPTRGALLTGYYAQAIRRDQVPGIRSGGRGRRPEWAPLIPRLLKPFGYHSYHSGKWHIDGMPCAQGFDRSYYLRDQQRFFSPRVHFLDDRKLAPVKADSGFYGTIAIADHAVEFLKEHHGQHRDAPFFLYVAFTAPHFPLHALPQDIERYRGRYDDGWQHVRMERWERVREMGLVRGVLSPVESDIGPPYHFPDALRRLGAGEVERPHPWNELTAEQRRFQSTKMELHAAMVDRIDREVGRILEQLDAMGATENTLVLFLSDNGASAEIMIRGDGHDPAAPPGSAATHYCLGPGWSTVCNTPFRRHKTWVHEGGIATPLIACWPAAIADRGALRNQVGHVVDIVPTLLELAGGWPAAGKSKEPPYHGRSLARALAGSSSPTLRTLWWLHEGHRALRRGDWKIVATREEPWELYDLSRDRTETNNLAERHPDRLKDLVAEWERRWEELRAQANPQTQLNRRSRKRGLGGSAGESGGDGGESRLR